MLASLFPYLNQLLTYQLHIQEAFISTTVSQNDPAWLSHLARNIVYDEPEESSFLTPDAADLIRKASVVVGYNLTLSYILCSCYANPQTLDFSTLAK